MNTKKILPVLLGCTLTFASGITSCSSAPKRSMMESTIYNATVSFLENANSCILTGDYEKADFLLGKAHDNAMSIDNYDLLASVALAKVSLCLSFNPPDFIAAQIELEKAYNYASYSEFAEKQTALCVLGEVRVTIANPETQSAAYNTLLSKLEENKKAVKGDAYNEANFLAAEADIYKLQNNFTAADSAYVAAAKSFTDNRYLSEIGITWYKDAQVRSLNGNKSGALQALENAIHYDRLAENSMALGADYYAKGVILLKGNPTPQEKEEAAYALEHSAQIYESAGFTELAQKSRNYNK